MKTLGCLVELLIGLVLLAFGVAGLNGGWL